MEQLRHSELWRAAGLFFKRIVSGKEIRLFLAGELLAGECGCCGDLAPFKVKIPEKANFSDQIRLALKFTAALN